MSNESLSRFCEFCERAEREGIESHPALDFEENLETEHTETNVYSCRKCGAGWEHQIKVRGRPEYETD